jgi:hypothetical protein
VTPDKAWKAQERRVAELFAEVFGSGSRTPLSGSASGHGTSADIKDLPVPLYVEHKHSGGGKARPAAILSLFRDTRTKARREGKLAIVVNHEHGTQLRTATVGLATLLRLLDIAWKAGQITEVPDD